MDDQISAYRKEIDILDFQLLDAVSQNPEQDSMLGIIAARMNMVTKVAGYKRQQGLPLIDPAREEEIIASRCAYGEKLGLSPAFVTELFHLILAESHRAYTENKKI